MERTHTHIHTHACLHTHSHPPHPPPHRQLVALDSVDPAVRQAAAVNFKNLVKYRWVGQLAPLSGRRCLIAACSALVVRPMQQGRAPGSVYVCEAIPSTCGPAPSAEERRQCPLRAESQVHADSGAPHASSAHAQTREQHTFMIHSQPQWPHTTPHHTTPHQP